jgi:hypothetical protein
MRLFLARVNCTCTDIPVAAPIGRGLHTECREPEAGTQLVAVRGA